MSSGTLSTPDQARGLFQEVSMLTARKGKMLGSEEYWRGEKLELPASIRERTQCAEDDAKNYHISVIKKVGARSTRSELAIVTLTSPKTQTVGLEALRYKVVGHDSNFLAIECHEIEHLLPEIPSEIDAAFQELILYNLESSGLPLEELDDPAAIGKALFESAAVSIFRHEIEMAESEATARALGKFATTSGEADDLILIVHSFAEK